MLEINLKKWRKKKRKKEKKERKKEKYLCNGRYE